MIIRVFRPTIQTGKEGEFESFLRDTAIPLVSQQSGLLAQHVSKPREPTLHGVRVRHGMGQRRVDSDVRGRTLAGGRNRS
jgi:hypothetical protein